MKKNGFTLVELLAVIVILAIILVIAVPQIMSTIDNARLGAFRSTAKLLVSQAEKQYLVEQTLGSTITSSYNHAACSNLAKLDGNYSNCSITMTNGTATLTIAGAGKFAGYNCKAATSANIDSPTVSSSNVVSAGCAKANVS